MAAANPAKPEPTMATSTLFTVGTFVDMSLLLIVKRIETSFISMEALAVLMFLCGMARGSVLNVFVFDRQVRIISAKTSYTVDGLVLRICWHVPYCAGGNHDN
eukprot:scaffold31799_cov76-Amphora_coffeaeformis.AAC.1